MAKFGTTLQQYPRKQGQLLAITELFPVQKPSLTIEQVKVCIDNAYKRCLLKKSGGKRNIPDSPEKLVDVCLEHLRTRSDPILSPYFVSLCDPESLFELDAVSHEMQRHRMTIGVFYQYLLLELMRTKWPVFDGSREGDIIADVETPGFTRGLRLYMSVKKSKDTVGGQDVGGVIRRLESMAKEEKNLTRPYLCVVCVATPSGGRLLSYEDRQVKCNNQGAPYSLNCEYWGPGFVFPYITGRNAKDIYLLAIKKVAEYLPFLTLQYREECARLLKRRLRELGLLLENEKIDPVAFLNFSCKSG